MIICLLLLLWLSGFMYIWCVIHILQIIARDDFFYGVEQDWKATNFVGKTLVMLLLVIFLPVIVLCVSSYLCVKIYYFIDEIFFPRLYSDRNTYGVRVVLPENNVLDLLMENKILFSIGNGFIRFPDNETFDVAKEFLGSYKIWEE